MREEALKIREKKANTMGQHKRELTEHKKCTYTHEASANKVSER